MYATRFHHEIFASRGAMDYAIVGYDEAKARKYLAEMSKKKKKNKRLPKPLITFYREKSDTEEVLRADPKQVLAWAHSSKMQLFY